MSRDDVSHIPFKILLEGLGEADGEFIRFLAPRTVDALLRLLPLQGRVAIWREQVYFQVPLKIGVEKGVSKVDEGDVAYWPMGNALCIFRGAMQPHGSVNLVGRILSGLELFRKVQSGTPIKAERSDVLG
jgi:hypothetical protein